MYQSWVELSSGSGVKVTIILLLLYFSFNISVVFYFYWNILYLLRIPHTFFFYIYTPATTIIQTFEPVFQLSFLKYFMWLFQYFAFSEENNWCMTVEVEWSTLNWTVLTTYFISLYRLHLIDNKTVNENGNSLFWHFWCETVKTVVKYGKQLKPVKNSWKLIWESLLRPVESQMKKNSWKFSTGSNCSQLENFCMACRTSWNLISNWFQLFPTGFNHFQLVWTVSKWSYSNAFT